MIQERERGLTEDFKPVFVCVCVRVHVERDCRARKICVVGREGGREGEA